MPKQATYINEHLFLQELIEQLSKLRGIHVEDAFGDNGIDVLVVDPYTGKRIAIECKSAREYGELPIATMLPIARLVKKDPTQQVILVSFSSVPDLLSTKLKELNVQTLTLPTVSQVVEKVQLALSA